MNNHTIRIKIFRVYPKEPLILDTNNTYIVIYIFIWLKDKYNGLYSSYFHIIQLCTLNTLEMIKLTIIGRDFNTLYFN